MSPPPFWPRAVDELRRADRVLCEVIDAFPGDGMAIREDPFLTLVRSIVGQQISVRAASSIWARVEALVGPLTPRSLALWSVDELRACGLSGAKARYLLNLADHFLDGTIEPRRWRELDDEGVIEALTRVKGIGRWTAEMFLIFHLLRPDVLPIGDIGLQRAAGLHYGHDGKLTGDALVALAEPWRPWRSVATWYLWRSLDPLPVSY